MQSLEELLTNVMWREVPDRAVSVYKKYAHVFDKEWEKGAESPFLRTMAEYMNLTPGEYPGGIPNSPAPLASMLVGGLAGAGLGYGIGRLGEAVMPNTWQRGRLRRTGALIGGALGAAPGATWGAVNMAGGDPFNSNHLFQERADPVKVDSNIDDLLPLPDYAKRELKEAFQKTSELYPGSGFAPGIDVDYFNSTIWNDPRVSERLDTKTQAAATGLITGAANLPGKSTTQIVTPFDVARLAAGMGSGYLSGMLVGKALGIMMGMPTESQEKLKTTGMYAGLISNLIPIAFGA